MAVDHHDEAVLHANQRAKILAALQGGPKTNIELGEICQRFGARIRELRQVGWPIETKKFSIAVARYSLVGPQGLPPPPVLGRFLFLLDPPGVGDGEATVEGSFKTEDARDTRVAQLVSHGFSHDEIFLMDTRFKKLPAIRRSSE